MKKINLALVFIALTMLSACNSHTNNKSDKNNASQEKNNNELPFDLANLKFTENINDVLLSVNISKKDTIKNDEVTLLGNEKLVFESEKLLVFEKIKLTSNNDKQKNNIIFHYGKVDPEIGAMNNEKDNILGMYQINLFNTIDADKLFNSLSLKFGTPNDTFSLGPIKTFFWIKNEICYYYFTKDKDQFYRVLFVYKKADKEWIDFIGGLGFDSGRLKLVK